MKRPIRLRQEASDPTIREPAHALTAALRRTAQRTTCPRTKQLFEATADGRRMILPPLEARVEPAPMVVKSAPDVRRPPPRPAFKRPSSIPSR